jgi:ribonuclease HIII
MEFSKEDIELIVKQIVLPCINEYSKMSEEIKNKAFNEMLQSTTKIVDMMIQKVNKLELENLKNLGFIKSVLFVNHFSNEECYKKYIAEWDRLNADLINSRITTSISIETNDDVNNT